MDEKSKQPRLYRVGGPDEALALLWGRGDEPEDIAARFKIDLAVTARCVLCEDCGWVRERHPDKPWEGPHACPLREFPTISIS